MSLKSLKFWHNWFQPKSAPMEPPSPPEAGEEQRRHPAAITIRTALRQKQKMSKAAAQ